MITDSILNNKYRMIFEFIQSFKLQFSCLSVGARFSIL